MDKTVIIFIVSFVFGIIAKNLPDPSLQDPNLLTLENAIIGATHLWLAIHYIVAIITLIILGIVYLNKKLTMKHFAPLAFSTGFLAGTTTHELVEVLNSIAT
jgi:L-asparagine transporter-like permease